MDEIDLSNLKYKFSSKPLLIGGKAMEFYGLRKSGNDVDFVVTREDWDNLAKLYPDSTQDLFGDLGVKTKGFELWTCITLFDYDFLSPAAIEKPHYKIISLEKLLFLKTMAAFDPYNEKVHEKNTADVKLLVRKIIDVQYGQDVISK